MNIARPSETVQSKRAHCKLIVNYQVLHSFTKLTLEVSVKDDKII